MIKKPSRNRDVFVGFALLLRSNYNGEKNHFKQEAGEIDNYSIISIDLFYRGGVANLIAGIV